MGSKYITLQRQLLIALTSKETPNGSAPLANDKALAMLERTFSAFPAYVNSVLETAALENSPIRWHVETEEWQDIVMEKDRKRRNTHELAIASITKIKRLCKHYGIDCVINIDENDRYQVADFCCEYINDIFYSIAGGSSGRRYNMEDMCEKYKGDRMRYPENLDLDNINVGMTD